MGELRKADAPYPYHGINGVFYDRELLDGVWKHLRMSAALWSTGLVVPSPADRLAYHVMSQITERMPIE